MYSDVQERSSGSDDEGDLNWPCRDKVWAVPTVPRDSEGFIQSFEPNQVDEYKRFFDEFGFVVVNNVITKQQVEATIDEIWKSLEGVKSYKAKTYEEAEALKCLMKAMDIENDNPMEAVKFYSKAYQLNPELQWIEPSELFSGIVDRNNPTTWDTSNWPASAAVGFLNAPEGLAAWTNRQSETMYSVFKNIIGRPDLWIAIDRYGVMRPTRNIPLGALPPNPYRTSVEKPEGSDIPVEDRSNWKTLGAWTHWDLNPWKWTSDIEDGYDYRFTDFISENNGTKNNGTVKVQALINMSESHEEDGGFCLVPGFHKLVPEWCELTKSTKQFQNARATYDIYYLPDEDSLHRHLVKIPARAGSVTIWRGEMPHCNFPNDSHRFRMNQYLKFFPAHEGAPGTEDRKQQLLRCLKQVPQLELTSLGKKLFGLESWNSEESTNSNNNNNNNS